MSHTTHPRNPAHLLGLGEDPTLCRLLRACGVEEACITGGASDYDKFLALAAALPLCGGHPLRERVNVTLTAATGLALPLCPHTARAHWEAFVRVSLYGEGMRAEDRETPPAPCPHCLSPAPTVWCADEVALLPDPLGVKAESLPAWSAALEMTLPADARPALFTLPPDYAFVRPNPYHAGLAVARRARGEDLPPRERHLLVTQALRVWGLALVSRDTAHAGRDTAHADGNPAPLLLRGGDPEAMVALLAYLNTSAALPATVWLPCEPSHAAAICGLYPAVSTGYVLSPHDTPETVAAKEAAYATAAPIGRAILLRE